MIVDRFQHWLYTNIGHSHQERDDYFESLLKDFQDPVVNWAGFENIKRNLWQNQLHIFEVPFYYIEYAIAQLGALQNYRNFVQDPEKALHDYSEALKLGNSKPIPDVWQRMNCEFDFSANKLSELMSFVTEELDKFTKE